MFQPRRQQSETLCDVWNEDIPSDRFLCFIQQTHWEQVRAFGTSVLIEMQIESFSRVFLGFVPNPFQLQPSACFALSHVVPLQFFIQTRIMFLNVLVLNTN
jgi:hypothetical protein